MNKLIIGAVAVLVVLVAFTLFITSFTKRNENPSTASVTPIPTQGFDPGSKKISQDFNPNRTNGLSDDEQETLAAFQEIGDIETEDFAIACSVFLNQCFIQEKTSNATEALNKFMEENNLTGIRSKVPGLFVLTDQAPRDAIFAAENEVKDDDTSTVPAPTGKTDQDKNIYLMTTMTNNINNMGKSQRSPSGKGPDCSNAQGNAKILCAARAYNGLPYKNRGPGATFGHPPSAWVQGYEAGNPSFRNLDCSGLVNVAMFKAFGQDMQAFSGTYYGDARYKKISLGEARPGDLVIMGGPNGVGNRGHIAIFESLNGNNLQIFNAAGRGVRSESGNWMKTRPGFQIVRYIGPGGTP
ncbi:hypothetical protein A3H84_02965 [Candidatus Roizmanbacteria bacterium RIFCSPLOWO2_02_FULL_40_13]|nr:MAG: hypothetical protein A3H84_02965 [Candidatus Roizmanbacteria bacterium RIFCSPLOWO2_02_FULL_40_13]